MDDDKLISIPLSILKSKVEQDFEEYMFFHANSDPDDDKKETFPMYKSTQVVLEALEKHGVIFNKATGVWES